jgi:hypothetical protein
LTVDECVALVAGLRAHGVTSVKFGDFEALISPPRPVQREEKTHAQTEEDRRRELLAGVM